MPIQTELRSTLRKPLLFFVTLIVLNGVIMIAISVDHFLHVQPYWRSVIYSNRWIWSVLINSQLIVGWFIYLQIRRRTASQQR